MPCTHYHLQSLVKVPSGVLFIIKIFFHPYIIRCFVVSKYQPIVFTISTRLDVPATLIRNRNGFPVSYFVIFKFIGLSCLPYCYNKHIATKTTTIQFCAFLIITINIPSTMRFIGMLGDTIITAMILLFTNDFHLAKNTS